MAPVLLQGSYLDPLLVEMINSHNALAMGLDAPSVDQHVRLVHELQGGGPAAAPALAPGSLLSGSATGTGAASNTGGHEHFRHLQHH